MAAPNFVPEFDNPLFLKTCCDHLIKRVNRNSRGLPGVTSTFEFHSGAVADAVEGEKLDRVNESSCTRVGDCRSVGRGRTRLTRPWPGLMDRVRDPTRSKPTYSELEREGVFAVEPIRDEGASLTEIVQLRRSRYKFGAMRKGATRARAYDEEQ
jgi:hypothetical protein